MEEDIRRYLLAIFRTYAAAKGLAVATVSRRFHGADQFYADFATGKRTITLKKIDEMLDKLSAAWPRRVAFPPPPTIRNIHKKKSGGGQRAKKESRTSARERPPTRQVDGPRPQAEERLDEHRSGNQD